MLGNKPVAFFYGSEYGYILVVFSDLFILNFAPKEISMDLSFSNIISAGALVYSIMQQKQLAETYENNLTDYKKELENYKNTIEANIAAMDKTITDFQTSQEAPVDLATGTFIVDLAGIADVYWSSAASLTVKNNDKSRNLDLYAVILDWGILDSNGNEVTANWMQWYYQGPTRFIIEPGKQRKIDLYGTDHQKLYETRDQRNTVRKIIKNGKKYFSKVENTWHSATGRMYLVTLSGDGTNVYVSHEIPVTGNIHYWNEGDVMKGRNKHTKYNGTKALGHYKNGSVGDPA